MPESRSGDGAAYDRLSTPMERLGREVLDRLELRGDETILDPGRGSGRLPGPRAAGGAPAGGGAGGGGGAGWPAPPPPRVRSPRPARGGAPGPTCAGPIWPRST